MKLGRFFASVLALFTMVGSGQAQSLSAAEIAAMVDERMGSVDEYAELLNDPDPDRSLAAMQIMIGLEDAQISRMALQHGLTSTSPGVRKAALKAYLDTGPILNIYIDGSSLDRENLTSAINQQSGTVDSSGTAFLSYKVGGFDAENGCYDFHVNASYCLLTLSESNVSMNLWSRWTSMTLNAEGNLVGMLQVANIRPSVPVTVPVKP
ncbi:MAG TPA: hypothetical protein DCS45_09790 [Roseovarius nubinhibens]|uniref:Uncharacterized protein n=1 Tax=Roseovarius nubinhibens TaxID=314263 RepID=A0A348WC89_9RHOB|nr:hypothetical protein [Roseovarius nubinhibens]